jgi:hypothetical protein
MTTSSAPATLTNKNASGVLLMLHNQATVTAYVAFGGTATVAAGYAIEPNTEVGPIRIPDGETQLSAILGSSTGNLRLTYCTQR